MADKMKADKISAARKKLKQFQSKTKTEINKSSAVNSDSSAFEQNGNANRTNDELVAREMRPTMNFDAFDPIQSSNSNRIQMPTTPSEAVVADPSAIQFHQYSQPNTNEVNTNVQFADSDLNFDRQNQEMASLLQMEKLRNHELSVKVTQQHAEIEKLRNEIGARNDTDSNAVSTIEKLRHDLNAHIQTVNVLVGEKADLTAKLMRCQQQIAEFESANIELQGRLNASRHRVNELEKDLSTLEKSHQKFDGSQQALCTELETLQEDNRLLKRSKQEACDETAEVQHQLQLKLKELEELRSVLDARTKELDMARLRLEQMTAGDLIRSEVAEPAESQATEQQKQDAERQIIELQNMVSELTGDRDRTQQQYQTYVQHLTKESTTQQQRVDELTKSNEKLAKREQSLVVHISELERQFQKQISTQQRLAALRDEETNKVQSSDDATGSSVDNEKIDALHIKLAALEKDRNDLNVLIEDHSSQNQVLRQQILEKENKINELETNLDRLRCETPNTTEILATIESDKVAASRAVAQNQALKQQLDEIQNAYVQVSNDKLELTNRLQSEQHLAREINNRFADVEKELSVVKEKLHFKDEEMIRLAHENTELTKQNLQLSQEVDRLRHYDATSNEKTTSSMHQQLATAKQEIRRLSAALKELQGKCDTNESITSQTTQDEPTVGVIESVAHAHDHHHHHHHHEHDHSHDHGHNHEHGHDAPCSGHSNDRTPTESMKDTSDVVSVSSTINIATNEAMDKLQDRFRRTMNEIADLTEEKQRLEHLVMQLQSETETVGEYIALYQTQRRLLKQRELEKDIQLHRIAADRTEMKEKLKQLNGLVELLLIQKGFNNTKEIMEKLNATTTTTTTNGDAEHPLESADVAKAPDGSIIENDDQKSLMHDECSHDHSHNCESHQPNSNSTHETATKIINLLSEIKDKNLNQDYSVMPNNLHHCSCCSGKLEIV